MKIHLMDANWDVSSVMYPKLIGVSGLCNIIPLKRARVTQPGLIKSRLTSQWLPLIMPTRARQGHTIHHPRTTLPELGGGVLVHGGTRLCGLTPDRAPPTSHQVHAALTRLRTCALHQTPSTDTSFRGGGFLSRNGSAGATPGSG